MKRKIWQRILQGIPLLLFLGFAGWYFISGQDLDAEDLQQMIQTKYLPLTILLSCLLFAGKSLTVFFPITVLYLVNGCLFSPVLAIAVSLLGTGVCESVPYAIGRFSSGQRVDPILKKYPKVAGLVERQRSHPFFLSFFLRVIHCLPGDLVSLYLGAMETPYGKYLFGSLLGMAPAAVTETWIGTSVQQQNWEMLAWSIGASLSVAAVSVVGYALYQRKGKQGKV